MTYKNHIFEYLSTFCIISGHNFWDTETWMFPSILLLYPQYANKLLQYRLDTAYVAAELAKYTGNKGYRYVFCSTQESETNRCGYCMV